MLSLDELTSQAQSIAAQLGIAKFDLYGSASDETSVQVDHGEPKQVKAAQRSSVIVRVWNSEQTMGVTSTTDVDPQGLRLALQTALEASYFGVKDHVPDFSPEATQPIANLSDQKVPAAPAAELLQRLVEAEKGLLAAHPAIQGVPYNGLAQRDSDRFYVNSAGSSRREGRSISSIYLYSKTEEPGKKPRSAGSYRVSHSLEQLDIQGCLQEAVEKTISHLNYAPIPTGQYTVVFAPEAFLSLWGAFSNLFNAQNILDKQSLSTPESLGSAIASPLLSVADDALHPANIGSVSFDGEGTPTRRIPILSKGILTHFLHSAGTAKRFNAQPTGHANLGAKVSVGSHFYHVYSEEPANQTYSLETVDSVVLIDDLHALHAGVKALQGSFSLPFDGWLIEKGRKTSIESATVAGDFLTLLKSILYVEPEAELTPAGVCPRIWVGGLSITGE